MVSKLYYLVFTYTSYNLHVVDIILYETTPSSMDKLLRF